MGHPRLAFAASALLILALAGCATPAEPGSGAAPTGAALGDLPPGLPGGEVIGTGTVLDDARGPRLCFAVQESYPPQCQGLPLDGWSWDGVEGSETASGVTWGAYAVQGTYDGETLAVTQPPILLALYDPMAPEPPFGGEPGDVDEATLVGIQEQLPERLGADYVSSHPAEGRLWVQVVWDDGTWQDAADAEFGEGVVVIDSLLREVG